MRKDATISSDGRYRYLLTREGEPTLLGKSGYVCWIMLNPSTADAEVDDPTVRRCISYTRDWGFDALKVVNLFALRATDPNELFTAEDPVGPANNAYIMQATRDAALVMAAWGHHGAHLGRDREVTEFLQRVRIPLYCLKTTATGAPAHPLRLPHTLTPILLEPPHPGNT